jgi:hypothetical protein
MKRFFFYIFCFFVIVPSIKLYTDIQTDNTTGMIYTAAKAMEINGVHNPVGDWLLLMWQWYAWLLGIVVLFELFRWIAGRKQEKDQQQGRY